MNLQQIEYVLALHKLKHFGLAAESCHISQATLSGMVKKLEDELGLRLFDRSRKPVKTTEVGLQFVELGKEIIENRDKLYHLSTINKRLEGQITIGVIPTIAHSLLPLVLPKIMRENPKLELNIVEVTTEEIQKQLTLDTIDFAIMSTPVNNSQFEEHILYYEPMMVYGKLDPDKEYISTEEIKKNDVWLLEEGHCFRNQASTICEIQERSRVKNKLNFRVSTFETLISLADRFGGITLLPELYSKTLNSEKKARVKAFQKPVPVREVSIVSYRQYANSQAINYLTKVIKDKVEPLLSSTNMRNEDLDIIGI